VTAKTRILITAFGAMALFALWSCDSPPAKKSTSTVQRTAVVKPKARTGAVHDPHGFCEKTYPAQGPKARTFQWPQLRTIPGRAGATPPKSTAGRWSWINLWATWCKPCMEEMGLIGRWNQSLSAEGAAINVELLTIDAPEDAPKVLQHIRRGLPGTVHWIEDASQFDALLSHIDVKQGTSIPIHALVDPSGQLRCVRVGAISALDFAAVKGILRGG